MAPDPAHTPQPANVPASVYHFLTHELRSGLATLLTLLYQGRHHPAEHPSHRRFEQLQAQTAHLLQRLDDFNQTLWPPPENTATQETLLENLLNSACDRARPLAAARQQHLQLQPPARHAFAPQATQQLAHSILATLQLTIAQAPRKSTIRLHCTLHPHSGTLHIGCAFPARPGLPDENIRHTLHLPTLVYD